MQVQNNKIAFSTIFQNEIQIDISPEICSPIRKRRIRSSHRCSIPPIARCLFTRSRVYQGQERNFHGGRDIFPFACHSHPSPTFPSFASDSPLSTDYIKDSTRMPPQILGETPLTPSHPGDPCAWQARLGEPNDHIHRIQFSLSSRGKMPAGVHDALLTLNADGCEIECQAVELKGDPPTRI